MYSFSEYAVRRSEINIFQETEKALTYAHHYICKHTYKTDIQSFVENLCLEMNSIENDIIMNLIEQSLKSVNFLILESKIAIENVIFFIILSSISLNNLKLDML